MTECDVVVVGAGVMGSATGWWLARRGFDTVLLEQFEQGHSRGSSHGSSRIFRVAYPDPSYVEMARSALRLWREVEDTTGAELLDTTGGIDFGDQRSLQEIVDVLGQTGVEHEILGPADATRRWPGFAFEGAVVHQPDAGRIHADLTVRTFQEQARVLGATVHFGEEVRALTPLGDDSVVVTSGDDEYRARRAVITAGAWVGGLVSGVVELPPLNVTREQVFHFPSRMGDATWPSFIHHGATFIYGLQAPGDEGVKVAEHHTGVSTTADGRSFEVDDAGLKRVVQHVTDHMPGLDPAPTSATTCLYTNTPDESFFIQRYGPVVVGSACSGHAFKFASLIGQRLAELAAPIA